MHTSKGVYRNQVGWRVGCNSNLGGGGGERFPKKAEIFSDFPFLIPTFPIIPSVCLFFNNFFELLVGAKQQKS